VKSLAPEVASSLILIVDDQPTNLKVLRGLFANMGHQITFATTGQQAIERAQSAQPDLILLDLMLPDMSGLDVCRQLKRSPETANIPIIFLTASHELGHLVEAFDEGAADYVTKPFCSSELLTRVRHHLLLQNTQEALAEINQHLESEVQQRTAQLQQALNFTAISQRIIERVRDSLDEAQILSIVVRELANALVLERVQTGVYNLDQGTSLITQGYPTSSDSGQVHQFADFPEIYPALLGGNTVQLALPGTPRHDTAAAAAFLACPLRHDRQIIGDLWLYRMNQVPFSAAEIQLVEHVAAQSAIAIRQARLYQTAQGQVEALEQLSYAKDDFLKTISHELKTPLTTIKAAAGTLGMLFKQPNWQAEQGHIATETLTFLNEGCDREIQIVNHLLELVHLDVGAVDIVMAWTNSSLLLKEVMRFFEQSFRQRNQTLNVTISESSPPLFTNAEMLERILIELLDNALKYSPAEETIDVALTDSPGAVTFTISNSGVVLPDQQLERMFETFYRLPKADRWQHDGIGLGLALVKKQVDYLRGKISAQYDDGSQRLTFTATFPLNWTEDEPNMGETTRETSMQ